MKQHTQEIIDCKPVVRLWQRTPGDYFCVSSRPNDRGGWRDEWFTRAELPEVADYVNDIARDHHVYFSPLAYFRRRRKKDVAVPAPLLYADLDNKYHRQRLLEWWPALLWETSPRRRAAIWVTDDLQFDDHLNHRLTYYLSADPSGWDWTQVLRWPGTINWKYEDAPRGRVIECDLRSIVCASDLYRQLPQMRPASSGNGKAPAVDPHKYDWREVVDGYDRGWLRTFVLCTNARERRSSVCWRIACELVEAGATRDEIASVLLASRAFKSKHGENLTVLAQEVNRAFIKTGGKS